MDTRPPQSPVGVARARSGDPSSGPSEDHGAPERPRSGSGPGGRPRIPAARWSPESEISAQLDELARCLARMDAVMEMLEADLDRRELALAALVDPVGEPPPAGAPGAVGAAAGADAARPEGRASAPRPSRARPTTGRRGRRGRRRR